MTLRIVTQDATFRHAVTESLETAHQFDVQAHVSALSPDVVVVDAEAALPLEAVRRPAGDSSVTILVAPEIDAAMCERGRRLEANAYVRKDERLVGVIGLVIELASFSW